MSQRTQKAILTIAIVLNGFLTPSGMIYSGWPGLYQMLKDDHEYADGCVDYSPKKTCGSQDNKLNTIYAVGANLATVATIAYGFSLDRFGVRSNAISGALLLSLGFVLLGVSESSGFDAFIPGFSLIAWGGLGTYLAAFQFSVLYARPTVIMAMLSALFGASGLIFTFFQYLSEHFGYSREALCLAYAAIAFSCAVNMLLLYPSRPYKAGDLIHLPVLGWLGLQQPPSGVSALDSDHAAGAAADDGANGSVNGKGTTRNRSFSTSYAKLHDDGEHLQMNDGEGDGMNTLSHVPSRMTPHGDVVADEDLTIGMSGQTHLSMSDKGQLSLVEVAMLKEQRKQRDLTPLEFDQLKNSRTLREELLHPGTILVALHFSIGLLTCNMYNANIGTLLKNRGDESGDIANVFVFVTALYPILFSLGIDWLQRKYRFAGTSFLSTALLIIGFLFLFSDNLYAQIPSFFIFATGRALLITVMFSFCAVEYRGEHYGRVVAFVTTICAAIGLLQLLLQYLLNGPANDNFDYFTAGMIIALAPMFYFSYWCHINRV